MRVFPIVALTLLAGCASADLDGNGTTTSTEVVKKQCDGDGTVRIDTNGSGSIHITVQDATGAIIFTKTIQGTGQTDERRAVSGEAGQWTMTVRFGGGVESGGQWTGQWSIGLSC